MFKINQLITINNFNCDLSRRQTFLCEITFSALISSLRTPEINKLINQVIFCNIGPECLMDPNVSWTGMFDSRMLCLYVFKRLYA